MNHTGRLIVSVSGKTLTDAEREMLKHPMLAGVILFAANYANKDQLKQLITEIESIADLPIFADQEGGHVQRFRVGFRALPGPRIFGETYDLDKKIGLMLAEKIGLETAKELVEVGVINLAPVCDVDQGNSVISGLDRSFHANPKACTELLFAYTKGMNAAGMQATGKHFPGHGQNNGDTHENIVIDNRSLAEIEQNDLVPFIKLIKANKLAAIMPAHIIYTQVDPDNTAGSSKIWLENLLRNKYGFNGVIVSDCLSMTGAAGNSLLEKTEKALSFGDVAILCHQKPEDVMELLDILQAKNYALDAEGQARFAAWVDGSAEVRNTMRAKFAVT